MKILVTGASGFVGQHLSEKLIKENVTFNAVVRRHIENLKNVQFIVQTFNAKTDWHSILKEVDVVIHLAGRAHVMTEDTKEAHKTYKIYEEINVNVTKQLAIQAVAAGVKRFIFISSIGVNGNNSDTPFNETHKPNPQEHYAMSKKVAEDELKELTVSTNLEVVIIRPPLVYGKGVKANFRKLIKLSNIKFPLPFGAINNKRSLIYIENLVDFIMLCTTHPKAVNETFLISDDDDVSTTDLIRGIAGDKKPYLIPIPQSWIKKMFNLLGKRAVYMKLCGSLQADVTKAKTLLDWNPPYTFKQGITKTMRND